MPANAASEKRWHETDFPKNPQQFIEIAAQVINRCKQLALVDGIRYQCLGGESFYAQELFETETLFGYIRNMLLGAQKSVYEDVVYDMGTEHEFAQRLEDEMSVKVYTKLPGWFKVPTPLGSYNPDWAVLIQDDDGERLYFVVETKGSMFGDDLRKREAAKIECGKAHFAALKDRDSPVQYRVKRTLDELLSSLRD